ncbi:hypothetical protein GCM10011507_29150 [Edaphobacter acidisoli]|uniref:Cytochrome b561 domain-containing protein n=1 Tax=Edaphobacter acidisoli TaxID=2040573 RepID=A0A916W8N7_9BACT|nr:hypothetical protein [Edaphobacter acidisoli]GGA75945.1 hypothetical protein GCM10011507_29150 [Edaphobacter acidisoli]
MLSLYPKTTQLLGATILLLVFSPASRAQTADALPDAPTPQVQAIDLAQNSGAPQQPSQTQPQQPSSSSTEPSLSDLGLTTAQTQGSAQAQALLDKRTHMLKVHQKLGLLTLIPLAATVISSAGATASHQHNGSTVVTTNTGNTTGRDLHAALGSVSVGMYAATAWYAIRAPKVPGVESRGAIRVHKALIWIHAPGMVLTPVLGAIAFKQLNSGERIHGVASAHAAVAWVTVASYSASIVAVSWPIHLKF